MADAAWAPSLVGMVMSALGVKANDRFPPNWVIQNVWLPAMRSAWSQARAAVDATTL